MTRRPFATPRGTPPWARPLGLLLGASLAGCASLSPDEAAEATRPWTERVQAPPARLALSDSARAELAAERERLLQGELDEAAAVRLALRSSPRGQALLAEGWALQSERAAAGTWPGIELSLERIVHGDERARGATLSFGLVEWLTLPLRRASTERALIADRLQLAQQLLTLHTAVRQQWIRAVAAAQRVSYADQVLQAAEAGAELARRMQQVGNFSRLQRAREQAFAVDAQAQHARAQAQARSEREALVRLLGLDSAEAARLRLPARLPAAPELPAEPQAVTLAAQAGRLDLALAHAQWQQAAASSSQAWTAWADVELALGREREGSARSRSTELAWHLPWVDGTRLRQQSRSAAAQAAALRLEQLSREAASQLRERYASYRAAHALERHARLERVPLHQAITDETLLKYNGMLVGVFDLLADARGQVAAVIAALEAQQDFWLASAALDAAVIGIDAAPAALGGAASPAAPGPKDH